MNEQLVGKTMMICMTHTELKSARDFALKYENTKLANTIEQLLREVKDDWYGVWRQADIVTRKEIVDTGSVPSEIYKEFVEASNALKGMEEAVKGIADIIDSMGKPE